MAVYGVVGCFAVCDCGTCIFWSDSLFGREFNLYNILLCNLMGDNLL